MALIVHFVQLFVRILFVFLYDTLMMVTEATETCWWILIYDKTFYWCVYVGSLHSISNLWYVHHYYVLVTFQRENFTVSISSCSFHRESLHQSAVVLYSNNGATVADLRSLWETGIATEHRSYHCNSLLPSVGSPFVLTTHNNPQTRTRNKKLHMLQHNL